MKKYLLLLMAISFSLAIVGCTAPDEPLDPENPNVGDVSSPTHQIRYTATEKIEPYDANAFDVNIVSNDWDSATGEGVITFDGEVTKIEEKAFYNCSSLTGVTIPNSVTCIGKQSFSQCSSLKSVTIPNSVTEIGRSAFYNCHLIKSVTIPNSVTSIGASIFGSCNNLEYYYGKFASADNRCLIVNGTINSYAAGAKLTSYTISNDVVSIGNNAFADSDNLKIIHIPENVTSISYRAFYHCSKLIEIVCKRTTPPNGGNLMFDYNASNRKIFVPRESVEAYKSAQYWSDYADNIVPYSGELGTITYTSSDGKIVKPYTTNVFGATIISNTYENDKGVIKFNGAVTQIGDDAFRNCSNLTTITIPDGVTKIGVAAFCDCSNLTSVTIGNRVTSIGEAAFCNCKSLTSVTIPDSVIEIGTKLFAYCSSLKSVVIGNSVNSIEASTFAYCTSLTSITIPDSVTSIKTIAFDSCSSLTAFYGKFASEDNRCLVVNGALNAFAPAGLTEYTIPDSVTSIGEAAFYSCESLTSITIPDSVTSIGYVAFRFCTSLTSVTIPDSVTSIGEAAFYHCESLTSVTIPDSVTSIEQHTFCYCSSLTSVTIGNGVTEIGWSAFVNCSSLIEVYCKPTAPPTVASNMLSGSSSSLKIYVPQESVEAYKSAQYWCRYSSEIVGYDF